MIHTLRDMRITHGCCYTTEYGSWKGMKARCQNPKHRRYTDWGGRGITVCPRWQKFENFIADMGKKPPGTTIDRWPNLNGNYEPGNCRWATPKEQAENRRPKKPVSEWRSLPTGRPKGLKWSEAERAIRMKR